MQNFYFLKKLNNILLVTKKKLSFDKNLGGDFQLKDSLLKKNELNGFQSFNKFYHLTNLETFKKLQDL